MEMKNTIELFLENKITKNQYWYEYQKASLIKFLNDGDIIAFKELVELNRKTDSRRFGLYPGILSHLELQRDIIEGKIKKTKDDKEMLKMLKKILNQ